MMAAAKKPDAFKAPLLKDDDDDEYEYEDAFERMMDAASVPGIFAPSVTECIEIVKESPKIREIIGIFRRCLQRREVDLVERKEKDEIGGTTPLECARKEQMYGVRGKGDAIWDNIWVNIERDKWLLSQCELVPMDHPPLLQPWSETSFEGDLTSENINLRMGFVEALRNTGAIPRSVPTGSVPPPPIAPRRGTYLVGIKVHFDSHVGVENNVLGLSMIYNNDVEIPIGRIKGTKYEEIKLSCGEHIVAVQGFHHLTAGTALVEDPGYMSGIRFRTTKDCWLTADPEGEIEWYTDDDDADLQLDCNKVHSLESGAALHSIDFRPEFFPPIRGIQGIPIKELAAKDPDIVEFDARNQEKNQGRHLDNKTAVPTLQSLAYDALQEDFLDRADYNMYGAKMNLCYRRESAERSIRAAYFNIRANILQSEEAEIFRLIQLAKDTVMNGLELKRRCLENSVKAEIEEIKTNYYEYRDDMKETLADEQVSIYNEHLEFAQIHGKLSGRYYEGTSDNEETSYGRYTLCTFIECRKSFCPGKLPSSKRCVVDGCTSIVENCGCRVETCKMCHEAICMWHAKAHKLSCKETLRSKCGRCSNGFDSWLMPDHCNNEIPSQCRFECHNCCTTSCLDCMERCNGCWTKWCKRCVTPANFVYPCCENCQFPKFKK